MTDNLFDSLMEARRGIAHTMCARRLRECLSDNRWRRLTAAEPPPAVAGAGLAYGRLRSGCRQPDGVSWKPLA